MNKDRTVCRYRVQVRGNNTTIYKYGQFEYLKELVWVCYFVLLGYHVVGGMMTLDLGYVIVRELRLEGGEEREGRKGIA